MLVNNNVKLSITLTNLTCIIELKIKVSWNKTLLDYDTRVIVPHLAKERDLSHILKDRLLSLLKDNPSFSEVGVGAPLLPRLGNTVSCILNDRKATFVVVSCKTDT